MDPLAIAAVSGLRSRIQSLDLLANNLANTGTSGYKGDQEFYSLFNSEQASGADGGPGATLPVIQRQWTDLSQGTIQQTGNSLDVALAGKGFFVVAVLPKSLASVQPATHTSPAFPTAMPVHSDCWLVPPRYVAMGMESKSAAILAT